MALDSVNSELPQAAPGTVPVFLETILNRSLIPPQPDIDIYDMTHSIYRYYPLDN